MTGLERAKEYVENNPRLKEALGMPEGTGFKISPLGMGEHNLNYLIDTDLRKRYVLRVNVTKQPFHEDQVRYEFDALKALECSGCTPRPVYLDDSSNAPGKGVLVESFCEGRQLDFDDLKKGDLERVAQLMANIHSIPVKSGCTIHRARNPLGALYEECRGRYRLYLDSPYKKASVTKRLDEFMRICADAVDSYEFPEAQGRIVNTETLSSHFLLNEDSDTVLPIADPGSFVDWERPVIGDVAEDIAFFLAPTTAFWESDFMFTQKTAADFMDLYWNAADGRVPENSFEARFEAWQMMATLRALTWCTRAVVQFQEDPGLHRTEKAAAKVPLYLSEEYLEELAVICFGM